MSENSLLIEEVAPAKASALPTTVVEGPATANVVASPRRMVVLDAVAVVDALVAHGLEHTGDAPFRATERSVLPLTILSSSSESGVGGSGELRETSHLLRFSKRASHRLGHVHGKMAKSSVAREPISRLLLKLVVCRNSVRASQPLNQAFII
jgi:hypothetical protein